MARPTRTDLPFLHPSIDPNFEIREAYGHTAMAARVTCPHCRAERWYPLSTLRQQLKRPSFNGRCRPCSTKLTREGYFRWQKKRGKSRRLSSNGYVVLGAPAVTEDHLPLFRQMQGSANYVFEHRFVMAVQLGRPLRSDELVDHMDGDKTNNDISNLRLYIKGKQQPGSSNGYGTYYHEWQMALAELKRLKAA